MGEESSPLVPKRTCDPQVMKDNFFSGSEYHRMKISDLLSTLGTSLEGLTTAEVANKREKVGLNYVTPPINLHPLFCCIVPCISASTSMQKYHECIADNSLAKRNGQWIRLDSISLVPGDIVRLSVGDRVPADMRIFKSDRCIFDASSIMGRGVQVVVDLRNLTDNYVDSPNIAFMGYLCLEGDCTGVVLATGNDTLIGNLILKKQWACE